MTTADSENKKLLALGVNAAKFTAEELLKLIDKYLLDKESGLLKPKIMSYDEFQHSGGVSLLNVSMDQRELDKFKDTAQQNGVNITLKRNQDSATYYLCLQGQRQNIEKMLKEYRDMQRNKQRQRSLKARLERAKEQAENRQHNGKSQEQEHTRERSGNA